MQFLNINAPAWANNEQSAINVQIDTDTDGTIPFTATPEDSTDYGPDIFQRALAGEFGEIADYVEPVVDLVAVKEKVKARLMAEASGVIAPLQDAVEFGMATKEEIALLKAWRIYRVELNRVDTKAEGIVLPTPPGNINGAV